MRGRSERARTIQSVRWILLIGIVGAAGLLFLPLYLSYAASFPLKASANGRYLVGQDGRPFLMIGGSPQNLAHLSLTDATTYLSTRASQGFNSVQVYAFPWDFDHGYAFIAGNGTYPFTRNLSGGVYTGTPGTADFTTPNPAYFSYLDSIINLAVTNGFLIHLYAIDFGYGGDGSQGWWLDVKANSSSALQSLGTYLGSRYGHLANVIWVDGSDYGQSSPSPPDPTNEGKVVALVNAMKAAGATQLRTGDWNAPSLSTDEPLFASFMQLNGIYTYGGVYPGGNPNNGITYPEARVGWNYRPVAASQGNPGSTSVPPALPAYLKETAYEYSSFAPGTPADLRKEQWWAVLSGGTAGLFYENERVLRFFSGWQTTELNSPGALDMERMSAFLQSYNWWQLVPSELSGMKRLVTSSNGSQTGAPANYVASAAAPDGTLLFAYVPPSGGGDTQSLAVDMTAMSGAARARWWNPTSAAYTDIASSLPNTGTYSFTTPGANGAGANDWILVLTKTTAGTTPPAPPTNLRVQ